MKQRRVWFTWRSNGQIADQATAWANLIVAAINRHEKTRDVDKATNAIEYLQEQLSRTRLVEMQQVFYELIESQSRVIMRADVRDEYVFRVIDPAVSPDQRFSPNRKRIAVLGALAGFSMAVLFVLCRSIINKNRRLP